MIIFRFLFLVANDVAAGDFVATLWEYVDDDFEFKCKGTFDCQSDIYVCPTATRAYCMYGRCFCLSAWYPKKIMPT